MSTRFVYAKGDFLKALRKWWFLNGTRILCETFQKIRDKEEPEVATRRLRADAAFWIKQLWRRQWLDNPSGYPKTDIENADRLAARMSQTQIVHFFNSGALELVPEPEPAPLTEPETLGLYPEQHRAVPVFHSLKRLRRKPARYAEEF